MDLSTSVTIIGWFVQVLLDQGITFAIEHWGGDPDLLGALDSLQVALKNVCAFLPLAQGIRSENEGLQLWLNELKAAAYDAEDLSSEIDYYGLELQVEGENNSKSSTIGGPLIEATTGLFSKLFITDDNQASTSSPLPSSHDSKSTLVPRIREVVLRLERIFTELSRVLNLLNPVNNRQIPPVFPEASHRTTTSFAPPKETVIGRINEKDQIITSLLMPAAASVCVVPIVGMGGVGKTTLARMVYNDEKIEKHFDCKIWICVSDDFDVARLTGEMLECLGVKRWEHPTNLNGLQVLLMQKLQPVRFLLVLDDVWNESERGKWGSLCAPLGSQKEGSRILMTTRLNTVVSIAAKNIDMLSPCPLKGLPEDQSLSLFNTYAFGDPNPSHDPILVEIGKQIAGRLTGSPLAAKTVGGLLRDNLNEDHWRNVLKSAIWQLSQSSDDDIMPVLKLSYQHLPPHLQQCFTYCSVFPKDYQFEKDKLVAMWISQGYVHAKPSGNKSVEEIGSEYFDGLLSRSFIQSAFLERYVLHDLLHDLAESESGSQVEYLKINLKRRKVTTSNFRHVYVPSNNLSLLESFDLESLKNLRTLIIDGDVIIDFNVLKQVLNGLKSVRVLSLERVPVNIWWGSIGHLIHLRYLVVSPCTQSMSPDPRCRPYHLQWLIYSESCFEGLLPAATNYLVSLRHLPSGPLEISGIGKLTCLQELECFRVGKTEGRKLAELKRLNELKGTLRLNWLDFASTKEEALEANLNKKEGIRALELACGLGHATPHMAEEVFESLCPPPYIKELRLESYLGVESPTWMMTVNCCLSVLQSLTLYKCFNWKVLPPLGQLPLLRYLKIDCCRKIQSLPLLSASLVTLEIHGCHQLSSLFTAETETKLLSLRKITISGCDQLVSVDLKSLSSLQKLRIAFCRRIQSVPHLPATLAKLEIYKLLMLTAFSGEQKENLSDLTSLRKMTIKYCPELQSLPLPPASLQQLEIEDCPGLLSLPPMPTSLHYLQITSCPQLHSLPLMPASLHYLQITSCPQLHSLPLMPASLQQLKISLCPRLHSLPLMPASLQQLVILVCPELPRERYQEGGDDWHKISHVPDIDWNVDTDSE